MRYPPVILQLRIPRRRGRSLSLWLPWFLIYIALGVVSLLLMPFLIVLSLVLLPTGKGGLPWLAVYRLWSLLCSLYGLRIEIRDGKSHILLNFI